MRFISRKPFVSSWSPALTASDHSETPLQLIDSFAKRGWTIVEVLIVIIVLGIVAFTVVPRFTRAEESQLKKHLEVVRRQIELYRIEHGGQYPSATTEEAFLQQMVQQNKFDISENEPALSASDHGPYLPGIPINPYTGGKRITCGGRPGEKAGDWYYDPATGDFRANRPAEKIPY